MTSGRGAPHRFVVEPPAGDRAGPVVLDDDVRGGDDPQRDAAALGVGKVERDAALPSQQRQGGVVEEGHILVERAAAAGVVDPAAGLDLDHVGAHVGHGAGKGGRGPDPAQVDDAHPGEGLGRRAASARVGRHLYPP